MDLYVLPIYEENWVVLAAPNCDPKSSLANTGLSVKEHGRMPTTYGGVSDRYVKTLQDHRSIICCVFDPLVRAPLPEVIADPIGFPPIAQPPKTYDL